MRIGTWNIQGLSTKKLEVLSELEKQKVNIAVLSETKKKGKGLEEIGSFIHIYSGVKKEVIEKKGVSIVINKKLKRHIKKWDCINEYLGQVELEMKGKHVVIIGVYAPYDTSSDKEKTDPTT